MATPSYTSQPLNTNGQPKRPLNLMVGLAAGHSVKHFYQQAFLLLLPYVKDFLGLSDVGVGVLGAVRTISGALINIPAGIVSDIWRAHVGLMLTTSLSCIAIGYFLIGITPNYWLLLIGVTIVGCGASFWHAPAFGTLASAYPNRKATAFAVHRVGGSFGDSTAPILTGVLLGGFAFWGFEWVGLKWQTLALIMVAPALVAAVSVFFAFRKIEGGGRNIPDFSTYITSAKAMLTNSTVLGMVLLSGVRSMVHSALTIFLVIYMAEDLNFSDANIGFHVSLLTLLGIASSPLMGWASDKSSRRGVIFFSLAGLTILSGLLLYFDSGIGFTVILACTGIFLYSVNPIMMAAAIDATDRGTESSGVALMFTGGSILGALSPILAGQLRQTFGMDAVFIYTTTILTVVTIGSLLVPMKRL